MKQTKIMQGTSGDSSGSSSNKSSMSEVSSKRFEADLHEQQDARPREYEQVHEAELELGLGLGLGLGSGVLKPSKVCSWGDYCRILTAKDFPSMLSSSSAAATDALTTKPPVAGTKRAADSAPPDVGSSPPSQVVGWPPIRAYRKNSLVSQNRVSAVENIDVNKNGTAKMEIGDGGEKNSQEKGLVKSFFVKVNMDGVAIGRKVDLTAHVCYESLAQALEDMFNLPTAITSIRLSQCQEDEVMMDAVKPSKLLDGSSEYVLTYEDREGDWMLVGDVPWRMFLSSAKRLRIMKTLDANGLAPRFQHRSERQRSKPI